MSTEPEINPFRVWAVVPAAGLGRRMGGECPKQYLPLLGVPVIAQTLLRLSPLVGLQAIVVALHAEDRHWESTPKPDFPSIITVPGGDERCQSVYNGLLALNGRADNRDWVLVHDAARPCVRITDMELLLATVKEQDVGGLLATRITDTVKRGDGDVVASVIETVDRSGLWRALTPQVFRYGILRQALRNVIDSGDPVTDEAQAVERLGQRPLLVEGSADNIKITHPQDLRIAEFYLRQQTAG
ncbi:MAG TPA: 2-C-methyl-D-erythritol 4-phosphate cytidylyltransferase [Gammaproteobacteria bacterium]